MRYTFIISSVIDFKEAPLSYTEKRSVFSIKQRYEQTIQTIMSIKRYLPGAKLVLIEFGLKNDISSDIRKIVDQYIYIGINYLVRKSVDSKYKSLGEAIGLLLGSNKINREIIKDTDYFFKISGRYCLNDNFKIEDFNKETFDFKSYPNKTVSTRLYGFPSQSLSSWKILLFKCIIDLVKGKSIEESIYKHLDSGKYKVINTLGVEGLSACDGVLVKE